VFTNQELKQMFISPDLEKLQNCRLIDVRAPIEFAAGHFPGARNMPLLTDAERSQVGTTYKKQGKDAAIALGHQLVSGEVKEQRVNSWIAQIQDWQRFDGGKDHAMRKPIVLYCFRGGLRSRTTQAWLRERGYEIPLIEGGYKALRNQFMCLISETSKKEKFLVISGPTGSGKTQLLREIAEHSSYRVLDFEKEANHRGSAFGALPGGQPSQVQFENRIGMRMLKTPSLSSTVMPTFLVEDESRLVGSMAIPNDLFLHMRNSPVIWIDEPLEARVQRVFSDYILGREAADPKTLELVFAQYEKAILAIQRRLGGLRAQEILSDLQMAVRASLESQDHQLHKLWIEKLLVWYYDPQYLASLAKRAPDVAFKGNYIDCRSWLETRPSNIQMGIHRPYNETHP
jgi:tRNA 2-selenouridine synthase